MNRAINGGNGARMYQERGGGFSSMELASVFLPHLHYLKSVSKGRMDRFRRACVRAAIIVTSLTMIGEVVNAENSFLPIYSAQGVLTYTQQLAQKKAKPQYWTFEVAADNARQWKMVIHAESSFNGQSIKSEVSIVYDGTNIYSLTTSDIIKVNPANALQIEKIGKMGTAFVANICTGPYPIDNSSVAGIIWLAFFAGDMLDPTINQNKFPNLTVSNARIDPMAWSCDFIYELLQSGGHRIVKNGRFVMNPQYVGKRFSDYPNLDEPSNGGDNDRELFYKFEFMKSLKRESTAAIYALEETTNINGITIPTKFHVEIPTEAVGYGTNGYSHFDVQLTNYQNLSKHELLPELGENVTAHDRRMRVKITGAPTYRKEVVYMVTNHVWPTDTNDLLVQAAANDPHAGWRLVYSGELKAVHHNPKYVRLIIVLLCILPIGFFAIRRFVRRDSKEIRS